MSRELEIDGGLSQKERQALALLAERLERERPVPSPAFLGGLRHRLAHPSRSTPSMGYYRALAATNFGLGFLLLAVAGGGLAGTGPFAP